LRRRVFCRRELAICRRRSRQWARTDPLGKLLIIFSWLYFSRKSHILCGSYVAITCGRLSGGGL
jgi:hypothetical protein